MFGRSKIQNDDLKAAWVCEEFPVIAVNSVQFQRIALPAAWRILTELFRRHGSTHKLRLLHSHPGISYAGQLRLFVDPTPDAVTESLQLVMNIAGETGRFEIQRDFQQMTNGDYLQPALQGNLAMTLETIERAFGWATPALLPPSSPDVLVMRLIAEVLTAACLDINNIGVETAWFDWSGGCKVQTWVEQFGVDANAINLKLHSGASWDSCFMGVSNLVRIGVVADDTMLSDGWAFNLDSGIAIGTNGSQPSQRFYVKDLYEKCGRRMEHVAAHVLAKLRESTH